MPLLTTIRNLIGYWFRPEIFLSLSLLVAISAGDALSQPAGDPVAAEPVTTGESVPDAETTEATEITPDPALTEEPLYKSRSERNNKLLAEATAQEVRWLETPTEQALALYRPTETREKKGVLLLLHAAETPPTWPAIFENIRRALPQHGWATFAVALPPKSAAPLPERDPLKQTEAESALEPANENADPTAPATAESSTPEPSTAEPSTTEASIAAAGTNVTPEPTTETVAEPQPTRAGIIAQRQAAALAWLAQEQHTPVFLLVDNSSVMDTLAYLQTLPENPIAAMILVNLQAQEALTQAELEAIFTASSPPVLDVFLTSHTSGLTGTRKNHRAVALRNNVPVYQQLHLQQQLPATLDDKKTFWAERLRGFMEQQMQTRKGG